MDQRKAAAIPGHQGLNINARQGVGVMYQNMVPMDGTGGHSIFICLPIARAILTISPATTVLHEWTHISWIGETNPLNPSFDPNNPRTTRILPEETYGWLQCNSLAFMHPAGSGDSINYYKNADSFAWYAEYGYWVTVLGVDIWPLQPSHHRKAVPLE
jgi:hypothetical protein